MIVQPYLRELGALNGASVRLGDLDGVQCVLLVGPAGSGKTTLLRGEANTLHASGAFTRWVDMRRIADEDEMLAEARPLPHQINQVQQGNALWHLYFDGADEYRGRSDTFGHSLARVCRGLVASGLDANQLRIRVSSRFSIAASKFVEAMSNVFPSGQVATYEIQPLGLGQVTELVSASNVPSSDFTKFVEQYSLQTFATSPVNIEILLDVLRSTGRAPRDRADLLRLYVQVLLERATLERQYDLGYPTWDELLKATARLAAATALAGKSGIWTGNLPAPAHIATFEESASFPQAFLSALVDSGLLVGEFGRELTWRHKALEEYLAALALDATGSVSLSMELLQSEVDGTKAIRPQLREVAAWLAMISAPFAEMLIATEPSVLFESENALADDSARAQLASALLKAADDPGLRLVFRRNREHYPRLNHSTLAKQLRDTMTSADAGPMRKLVAIEIAIACRVVELAGLLGDVAHNGAMPANIRALAIEGVAVLGSDEDVGRLVALTNLSAEVDPEDEIRGMALDATWPRHLEAEKLFSVLWPRRNQNLIGSYSHFLYTLELPPLEPDAAVAACRWLGTLDAGEGIDFSLRQLAPAVLSRAWEACDDDRVAAEFAALLRPRRGLVGHLDQVGLADFKNEFAASPPTRRKKLFYELLGLVKETDKPNLLWLWHGIPWSVLHSSDLPWLLDALSSDLTPIFEHAIVDGVVGLTLSLPPSETEEVWRVSETIPSLAAALQQATTVSLDSEIAQYGREQGARTEKRQKQLAAQMPFSERFVQLATQAIEGDSTAWWRLNLFLLTDEDKGGSEFHARLDTTPTWDRLDASEKQLVTRSAAVFLARFALKPGWLETGVHHRPAASAYRALRLLQIHDPSFIDNSDSGEWERWALPLVAFSGNDGADERSAQGALARLAFARNPEALLSAIREYTSTVGRDGLLHLADVFDGWTEHQVLEPIWNLWIADTDTLRVAHVARLFAEGSYGPFRLHFARLLNRESGTTEEGQSIGRIARAAFLSDPGGAHWFVDIVHRHTWLTKFVFAEISGVGASSLETFFKSLPADTVGQLYDYADSNFSARPIREGSYVYTNEDYVEEFRQQVVVHLRDRSTDEAVAVLRRMADRDSAGGWIRWAFREGLENARRARLDWPEPKDLLKVLLHPESGPSGDAPEPSKSEDISLSPPSPQISPAPLATANKTFTFLFFADEWFSGRGGISTINRDLCVALAAQGHKVYCFIPTAEEGEIAMARAKGIHVVSAIAAIGLDDRQLLAIGPPSETLNGVDFVVGHDNVTGPSALAWARRNSLRYVHLIHSLPEEIATARLLGNIKEVSLPTQEKRRRQEEICKGAALVVCIGPRLYAATKTSLAGDDVQLCKLLPGLNSELESYQSDVEELMHQRCLFIGRGEDVLVKGIDLIKAIAKKIAAVNTEFVFRGIDEEEGKKLFDGTPCLGAHFRPYDADPKVVLRELKSASLLVMPSRAEGFGLAALEAVSAGVPILISERSGLAELLKQLADEGHISKSLVSMSILPMTESADADLAVWHPQVKHILENQKEAFDSAAQLRKELQLVLTWSKSAQALSERLASLA